MNGRPLPEKVTQADLDAVLGALRHLADLAEQRLSAALLVESQCAIAALLEAAEFDGVAE